MNNFLTRLQKEEEGQDLSEYALLLVLLAVVAMGTIVTLSGSIQGIFTTVSTNIATW